MKLITGRDCETAQKAKFANIYTDLFWDTSPLPSAEISPSLQGETDI